ncbi:MAG: hypothetical protein HFE63_03980 [Clostridiales bacterium]|nr:hypothetical protein [Clostridiales bacterium]
MKMKRYLSIALLIAMLVGITSCGDVNQNENDTESNDTTPDVSDTVKVEYEKPDVNYNGDTVVIAAYNFHSGSGIGRYDPLTVEEDGDLINDALAERNRKVEEELNIKLEILEMSWGDRSSIDKVYQMVMAGEQLDFAMQMECGINKMMTTEGMLVDLTTIPTLDLTHSWWNQNANAEYTLFDKQYAAVGDICFFNIGAPLVTYYNKQIVEDLQLADMYELVESGKWTIDKMIELANAASYDLNGDSVMDPDNDRYGLAGEVDTLPYMLISAGSKIAKNSNGDVSIVLNNERTVDICDKVASLLLDSNVTLHAQKLQDRYSDVYRHFTNKLMDNSLLFYSNQLLMALELRNMEADFGILPFPKYDEEQEDYISFANTWWSDHLVVPNCGQDLERVGYVLDSMGYYSQQYVIPSFIDQTVIGKSVRDDESANIVRMILDNQVFDLGFVFNWSGIKDSISGIAGGGDNFSSMYASRESGVLTELSKTIENMSK